MSYSSAATNWNSKVIAATPRLQQLLDVTGSETYPFSFPEAALPSSLHYKEHLLQTFPQLLLKASKLSHCRSKSGPELLSQTEVTRQRNSYTDTSDKAFFEANPPFPKGNLCIWYSSGAGHETHTHSTASPARKAAALYLEGRRDEPHQHPHFHWVHFKASQLGQILQRLLPSQVSL